ncbi:MAG: hypothetical protein EAZ77_17545 [Nostocales cyanobacterium]|nr:MAG: hypothetical protein EAZ77_17545 [Nostocales cyanobacterium]
MSERLLIAMVGTQDSGKSRTWLELFKKFAEIDSGFFDRNKFRAEFSSGSHGNVRTRNKVYTFKLTDTKFVKLFLICGSLEESKDNKSIQEFIKNNDEFQQANIVLCSIQYADNMLDKGTTLDYFISEGYHIYIHWLNPGINGKKFEKDCDLVNQTQHKDNAVLEIYEVEKDVFEPRIQSIVNYIYDWAIPRL